MLQSIGAVLAGYAAMVVLVMAGSMAWTALRVPGGMTALREKMSGDPASIPTPSPAYLAFNLSLSLFAAILGGWVTRGIAPGSPTGHLIALGAVLVVMGFVSARTPGAARQPGWYKLVTPMIALVGIALSTLLRA